MTKQMEMTDTYNMEANRKRKKERKKNYDHKSRAISKKGFIMCCLLNGDNN